MMAVTIIIVATGARMEIVSFGEGEGLALDVPGSCGERLIQIVKKQIIMAALTMAAA